MHFMCQSGDGAHWPWTTIQSLDRSPQLRKFTDFSTSAFVEDEMMQNKLIVLSKNDMTYEKEKPDIENEQVAAHPHLCS